MHLLCTGCPVSIFTLLYWCSTIINTNNPKVHHPLFQYKWKQPGITCGSHIFELECHSSPYFGKLAWRTVTPVCSTTGIFMARAVLITEKCSVSRGWSWNRAFPCYYMCVRERKSVCVCACTRACVCVRERVCACVVRECVWERVCVCGFCVYAYLGEDGRENGGLSVCPSAPHTFSYIWTYIYICIYKPI